MSAYNWIKSPSGCPFCDKKSNLIQTYMASSYDGDENGRFFDCKYEIGQQMRWYSKDHNKFLEWIDSDAVKSEQNTYIEKCEAKCSDCEKTLSFEIEFDNLTPINVRALN